MNTKNKLYEYFNKEEFKSLISALTKKYINYGNTVGTISLTIKNNAEREKLSKFLSKNYKVNDKIRIKVSNIQKSLDDSIFEGTTVNDLVLLFNPDIKTNKEKKMESSNYLESKINEYLDNYRDTLVINFFNNEESLKKIKYLITHDDELLNNIFKSLINFPIYNDKYENLAIFSSFITGNPHYFDLDSKNSNVLIQFICYIFDIKYENKRSFKREMLSKFGILTDEVSNFVITYNLYGNELLDVFKDKLTPINISLANIRKMDKIKAVNNKLLIVENPSFLGRIIDMNLDYSVIATSGNSNSVIYKIIDKIEDENRKNNDKDKDDKDKNNKDKNNKDKNNDVEIYFNGDFDPEGLLIAQNFKDKYPNIRFIGYNEDWFYNGISDNDVNELRLKKLDKITDKDLCVVKDLIINNNKVSYQENNYDMLLSEIKKIN